MEIVSVRRMANARLPRMLSHVSTLLSVLSACAGGTQSVAPQQTPSSSAAASQPAEMAPQLSLPNVARACELVQLSEEIPVGCSVERVGDGLVMILGFDNEEHLNLYLPAMATYVAGPFCAAASGNGNLGRVLIRLARSSHGYVWDCQLARLRDFEFEAPPQNAPNGADRDPAVAGAAACERIHADESIPVACSATYANGMAVMEITFRNEDEGRALIKPIVDNVVSPFCVGIEQHGAAAVVRFIFLQSKRGQAFNCESRKWGEWFRVDDDDRQGSPTTTTATRI